MKFKLSTGGRFEYTAQEREIFALLPSSIKHKVDTNQLVERLYSKNDLAPIAARNSIIARLSYLQVKVDRNREPFKINKSKRAGPHPISFWLERRA